MQNHKVSPHWHLLWCSVLVSWLSSFTNQIWRNIWRKERVQSLNFKDIGANRQRKFKWVMWTTTQILLHWAACVCGLGSQGSCLNPCPWVYLVLSVFFTSEITRYKWLTLRSQKENKWKLWDWKCPFEWNWSAQS